MSNLNNAIELMKAAIREQVIDEINEQLALQAPNVREDATAFNGTLGISADTAVVNSDGTVVMARKVTSSPRAYTFPRLSALVAAAEAALKVLPPNGATRSLLEDAVRPFRY